MLTTEVAPASFPSRFTRGSHMAQPLRPDQSCVGIVDSFSGNFTKALFLRGQSAAELERRIGYGSGRLAKGFWLVFAIEKPAPDNFEFGGYTHFSGSRIGPPAAGAARPHVEQALARTLGSAAAVAARKTQHIAALTLSGPERLAKVVPVTSGSEYPAGSGIYQCNIPRPIRCTVAAFVPPGGIYSGKYTET